MTRGAMGKRARRVSAGRGSAGGGRGAPRERRDASDEKARSRRQDPPPTAGAFYLAPSEATGSVRGLCGVWGERTSEGFLPPFFLFLGAILSGRWTCAGAATGARVWRRRRRKSILLTIRRLFSRARGAAEPQMRILRETGWDSEPSLMIGVCLTFEQSSISVNAGIK